jgi:hypothetical protein
VHWLRQQLPGEARALNLGVAAAVRGGTHGGHPSRCTKSIVGVPVELKAVAGGCTAAQIDQGKTDKAQGCSGRSSRHTNPIGEVSTTPWTSEGGDLKADQGRAPVDLEAGASSGGWHWST